MDRARRRRQGTARATTSGAVVILLLAALGLVVAPSATAAGRGTISIDAPATVIAGVPFDVTVTVVDSTGGIAPDYRGTVSFSTSDRLVRALPAPYAFTEADSGTHTFTGVTLVGTGSQRLKVRDVHRPGLNDATRIRVANAGASIRGEVLAGFDPITGAEVTVYDAVTGHVVGEGPADIFGSQYFITGLPAGAVKVGAVKPRSDYGADFANNRDTLEEADEFVLVPGQTLVQSWEAEDFGPYLDLQEPPF